MNRQQLYTLSGVLLASTAISGVAAAGTVGTVSGSGTGGTTPGSAAKIANTVFSTTATTADGVSINTSGGKSFVVAFTNSFTTTVKFSVEVDISGAQFNQSSTGVLKIAVRDLGTNTSSFVNTITAATACSSITPLAGKIIVDGCQLSTGVFSSTSGSGANASASAGGLILSGTVFNTANGLATVGNAIALSGSVYNTTNPSQSFESITSGNIITSAAPLTTSVAACSSVVASPTATPAAFDYLNATNGTGNTFLTMCLATVSITTTTALSASLTAAVDIASVGTSVNVSVASSILSGGAVSYFEVLNSAGGAALVGAVTPATYAAGTATFSLGSNSLSPATNFQIAVIFSGTTPIPAAAAGTVSVVFGKGGAASTVASPTASGATASISRGGFNGELNTFLPSSNTSFTSFARIHNMGATAGVATITVLNDATGAQLGTSFATSAVTTAPNGGVIQSGQTLQLSNKDIETAAGITAASGVNYTVQVTGPFIGYAQHIIFNPATGQLADLSGFRNHDAGAGNSP